MLAGYPFPGGSVVIRLPVKEMRLQSLGQEGSLPIPGEGNGSLPVVLPGKAHGPGRATVHGVQRFRHDIVTKQQATDCILLLSEGERSLSLLAAQGLPGCLCGMAGSFQLVLSACFKVSD